MFRRVLLGVVATIIVTAAGCSNEPAESTGIVAPQKKATAVRALSAPAAESKPPPAPDLPQGALQIAALTGEEKSTHSRILADLREVIDVNEVRVHPVAGRGPVQDLMDLLQNPEIDVAIVQTDAVLALKGHAQAAARERLRYLFRVPNKELHVLASRSIGDLRALEGRRVNIDRPGTGTHITARLIFERLGIAPDFSTDDQATAHRKLNEGEIDAAVLLASPPSIDLFPVKADPRWHLVPIPWSEALSDYLPSELTAAEYPHLITVDRPVPTVAVSRVLAVRDWPEETPSHSRLARFAEAVYARFGELQNSGRDLRWRELSPLATEPGWQRFAGVQAILNRNGRLAGEPRAFESFMAASGLCSLPESTAARVRFYNDFMEWRRDSAGKAPSSGPGGGTP